MLYHDITLGASTIQRLTRCKLIVRCGVGYDNVDRAFARERGIPVANVPDYGTEEVAAYVCGPDSLARAAALGVKAKDRLADNDGWGFFSRLGDMVATGPTLTNVNDFRAILIR